MGRPKCRYKIVYCPPFRVFKPEGTCASGYINITREELESLRLKNIKNLGQVESAERMGVSQSTFQRILSSAYKKVSEALIKGKELRIV